MLDVVLCLYTSTSRSAKHNQRTHMNFNYCNILLGRNNILIGIYQMLLLQLRFDMYSLLNEKKTLYFYMVSFVHILCIRWLWSLSKAFDRNRHRILAIHFSRTRVLARDLSTCLLDTIRFWAL